MLITIDFCGDECIIASEKKEDSLSLEEKRERDMVPLEEVELQLEIVTPSPPRNRR